MSRNLNPMNLQQQISSLQNQLNSLQIQLNELFKLTSIRTEETIKCIHKLQIDVNDTKLFLRTKLGAPDASRLKDLMKMRLTNERFDYRS